MSDWQDDLDGFLNATEQAQQTDDVRLAQAQQIAVDFLTQQVAPAFEDVKVALEKRGREVKVSVGHASGHISIHYQGREELDYTVECRVGPGYARAVPVVRAYDQGHRYKGEGYFRSGAQDYGCEDLTREEVRQHLINAYKDQVRDYRLQQRQS